MAIDLVRRACRASWTRDTLTPIDVGDPQAIDWPTLGACVRENRLWWAMAGLLTSNVAPAWLNRDALAAREKAMLINARALVTTKRIVPILQDAGLHPLVIKGPLLQQRLFVSQFVRASTDLDILLPTPEIGDAIRVLTANCYRLPRECDSPWWRIFLGEQHLIADDRTLCEIDLHDRVQQPGIPGPRHMDAFVAEAISTPIGRVTVPVLSSTSAWLLSCLSLIKAIIHREPGGAYAMEIAAAAIAAGPGAIAAFETAAAEQGMERMALFSIGAVETLFGLDLAIFSGRARLEVVPADMLSDIVLGRNHNRVAMPKRSRILWTLCDRGRLGRIGAYGGEAAWAAGAEICRRVYHERHHAASSASRNRVPRAVAEVEG